MRVLLVSANREHFPEPVFPVGVASLASHLLAEGAEVEIFDAGIRPLPLRALRRRLQRFRPDRVGVSLRNVDNAAWPCTNTYSRWHREVVCAVRAVTSAPVILGGSAFSILPHGLLALTGADAGVTGDGEAGVPLLLGDSPPDGRIINGRLNDLGAVRLPSSLGRLFPAARKYRTFGVQTARGCPHRCLYCTYPSLEGSRVRTRPPERVVDDLRILHNQVGAREFFIVDSTFNADEDQMAAVLEEIRGSGLRIRFSCYLSPGVSDRGLVRLLAEAGCVAVDFGTDSGSPRMLSSLRKSFTVDRIRRSSEWCRQEGIDFCHSLIFGGPGEDGESIAETVRLMDETAPGAVIAMVGMRIYPGAGLAELAHGDEAVPGGASLLEPLFSFSVLGSGETWNAVRKAAAERRNWFLPGSRNWSSSPWPKLLRLMRSRGPLWRLL